MSYSVVSKKDPIQGWTVFYIKNNFDNDNYYARTDDKKYAELIKNALNYYEEKILKW